MNNRRLQFVSLAAVIVAGFAAVWFLQVKIDAQRAALRSEQDEVLLRSPSTIRRLSLEFAPLMGAVYWTRAVQYFGDKHARHDHNLEMLWPLLDIATTLDPHLLPAYRFGSMFLSDAAPRGAGDPDHAVALLHRGIDANPDQWRLYQDLGNVLYFDAKNYPEASKAYATGGDLPGAKAWMKIMAAKIAAEGESLDTAFYLWQQVYNTSTNDEIRRNAQSHLRVLKVQLDLRQLDRLLDQYQQTAHHPASRISDLVDAGLLPAVPADSEGFPFILGPDGKAQLNPRSPLVKELAANKN